MKHSARLLALLLSVLMLAGIFSCASADEGDLTPYGAYAETVTVTTGKPYHADLNFADPNDTQENNTLTRLIKDKLNIDVKILWESDDYSNKLALEFASGNLPDFFQIGTGDYLLYRQMVDNEMLYDLGSIYEQCAGEYMRLVSSTYDNRNLATFTESNGAMYGIGCGDFDFNSSPQLWLRQDWLDELGLELPTSIDDLENILVQFKEKKNNVGLLLNAKDPMGGWGTMYSANALAEYYGAHPYAWVRDDEGKVVYGSTQAGTKEALAILADWYARGLIDPEFATRDDSANNALFVSGQAGIAYNPYWAAWSYGELLNLEGAKVEVTNCPLNDEGKYNVIGTPTTATVLCVRADYEHPEVVYKLLNIAYEGYRGINKEVYNAIQPEIDSGANWWAMTPTAGVNLEKNTALLSAAAAATEAVENGFIADESIYTSYELSVAKSAKRYADGVADVNTEDWINYHARYIASNRFDNMNVTYPAFSYTTESMADLWPSLKSLEQTTFLQIITGEAPVDSFDSFVEQWYAQGGQIVTDEINAIVG